MIIKLTFLQAKPIGLSGLVAHTFDVSPNNLAIAYLIMVGALDKIVMPYDLSSKATNDQKENAVISLLSVFAYLVGMYLVLLVTTTNENHRTNSSTAVQ